MKKAEAISILATSVRPREEKDRAKYDKAVKMAIEALKAQEMKNSTDAISRADVIRCKDCIYFHPSYCEIWSKFGTVQTRERGYCYMAERRTDGSN